MLRNNKGITLIALIITIIVLFILAGVALSASRASINMAKDNRVLADLSIVQHAILERYSKYKLTNDEYMLVGTRIEYDEAESIAEQLDHALPEDGTYYRLQPSDLEHLGLTGAEHTYIVSYNKGIAFNETVKKTSEGEYLYIDTK